MTSSGYAKFKRPDRVDDEGKKVKGDEVTLRSDPLARAKAERKGFTYVGPLAEGDFNPAVGEMANPEQDGVRESVRDLDAESIVKQAMDVVMRKVTGTWSEAEAAAESVEIRKVMEDHGSFPLTVLDTPNATGTTDAQAITGPIPTPVGVPAGADVSMTNPDGGPSAGDLSKRTGAPAADGAGTAGTATDGARGPNAPDLSAQEGGSRRSRSST